MAAAKRSGTLKELMMTESVNDKAERPRDDTQVGKPDHSGDEGHGDFVQITMVVNGQPAVIKANEHQPLSVIRQKALTETQNLAQPADNWEIKNEQGDVLDPTKKVGEFHFGEKVTLFLSLKAGVAGG